MHTYSDFNFKLIANILGSMDPIFWSKWIQLMENKIQGVN